MKQISGTVLCEKSHTVSIGGHSCLGTMPSCKNILTAQVNMRMHPENLFIDFLDLQLLVLVVLRESEMEPAAFRPINFHGITGLKVFHTPTCRLVLA